MLVEVDHQVQQLVEVAARYLNDWFKIRFVTIWRRKNLSKRI